LFDFADCFCKRSPAFAKEVGLATALQIKAELEIMIA
jgi:hypothetical protein